MIELMDESCDNILAVRFTGKLTEADYDRILIPRIGTVVKKFGAMRALIYMDDEFKGWALKAAWANTKLDFQFRSALEKVAVVGAPRWEEWCIGIAGLLVKGELKVFPPDRMTNAWEWLRA